MYDQGLRIISLGRTWNQPYSCSGWADLGATYPLVDDELTQYWDDFGLGIVPTNVIIDVDGQVRFNSIGFNENLIAPILEELLGPVDTAEIPTPETFILISNYPNPFNAGTKIEFSLEEARDIRLVVRNISGQEVAMLHEGYLPAGNQTFSWDGYGDNTAVLSSGIYLLQLRAGPQVHSHKLLLNK